MEEERRILVTEAISDIGRRLSRHVQLIEEVAMTENVRVLITEDTQWFQNVKTTTRRISIYQGQQQTMQDIISTTTVDKSKKAVKP